MDATEQYKNLTEKMEKNLPTKAIPILSLVKEIEIVK